jgi:spore coat polysaccharide biosynthesis protein SpsF
MIAVVLQARITSSRLPGKSLLPLGGEPLLLRVMEALRHVPCACHVLACPEDCASDFAPLAQRAGFDVVTGSRDDVLARYCAAIRRFGITRVIRATADNPFVFADAASALNDEAMARGADYAGYSGLPYGAGVESVSAAALLRAERDAALLSEREHVCPYLYAHGELFTLHRPLAPRVWQGPDMRVTVDTREDYERAALLYQALSAGGGGDARYCGERVIRTYREVFGPNAHRR